MILIQPNTQNAIPTKTNDNKRDTKPPVPMSGAALYKALQGQLSYTNKTPNKVNYQVNYLDRFFGLDRDWDKQPLSYAYEQRTKFKQYFADRLANKPIDLTHLNTVIQFMDNTEQWDEDIRVLEKIIDLHQMKINPAVSNQLTADNLKQYLATEKIQLSEFVSTPKGEQQLIAFALQEGKERFSGLLKLVSRVKDYTGFTNYFEKKLDDKTIVALMSLVNCPVQK
jgi:hypothetical protein